jgi:hypothetical protein
MGVKTDFIYPKEIYSKWYKDFYAQINGSEVAEASRTWETEKWDAYVTCSRGHILEKAGILKMQMAEGTIYDAPGKMSIFETLAYPSNPRIPGLIVMCNMSDTESMGRTIVFYCDLVIQNGRLHDEEKKIFADSVMMICQKNAYDYDEYKAFMAGRGFLGGNAGECGIMGFFEEKDIAFTEDLIKETITIYNKILDLGKDNHPQDNDYETMFRSRARMVEWLSVLDYGVKVARDNDIPLEVMESYGFPPVVKY